MKQHLWRYVRTGILQPILSRTTEGDGPIIRNGHVVLTDRPGVGLDVNDEALARFLRPGTRLFAEHPPF